MAPPVQFSGNDINALLSSLLTKKGGSDFSSMSVDPVMQYLNGNWQQNPRFTLNELYARIGKLLMQVICSLILVWTPSRGQILLTN